MGDLDLDAIQDHYNYALETTSAEYTGTEFSRDLAVRRCASDVPALIAEVKRLTIVVQVVNAALKDVSDLLDEARTERDALHEEIGRARDALGDLFDPECELNTSIRLLIETVAETREVTAEDIARAIEAADHAHGGAGAVAIAYRAAQQADASIARRYAKEAP